MRVTVEDTNQMCITTRCRSVEQFIAMFERYVDGNSIFVSTLGMRPAGTESAFVVLLADGTPVLRGRSIVRKAWKTTGNPFRLPGLLLGLRTLTPRSMQVFERMRGVRREETIASLAPPPPLPAPEPIASTSITRRYVVPVRRAACVSAPMALSFSGPTKVATVLPRMTALPPADTILPANPLTALSDAALAGFVDCTLYEADDARSIAAATQRARWWALAAITALVRLLTLRAPLRL